MDASELARWSRFAVKGGIGKCTASRDCVAQNPEDLMFLQDDEIVVLMHVSSSDGIYLGFCEGVVGKFSGADVKFHGKLKKPVFARRPGSVTASAHASPALSGRPIIPSPTPSDPSSSPFHLDKNDSELEINTIEQGPSEQSHSHHHHDTASYGHGYSSTSNTRSSSAADKSPGSDSSSIETPVRPSEDHQSHLMAIEVVDETGQLTHPLPNHLRQTLITAREEKGKGPAPDDIALTSPQRQDLVSPIDMRSANTGPGSDQHSHEREMKGSYLNETEDRPVIRKESIPTESGNDGPLERNATGDEPYSPSSEYTKDGGIPSEDSHIQRTSTLTVSDGGFGIGLSLLQGLANGDRDSRNWSESETDIESSFPKPPTQTERFPTFSDTKATDKGDQRTSAFSNASAAEAQARKNSLRSESDGGDGGFQWDDDDLLDDYRYSRYSHVSKTSNKSRSSTAPSITRPFQAAPPLPDDARPSLDGQSSTRSAPSPQPHNRTSFLAPQPLNIVKNNSTEQSPLPSPATPVPYGHGSDETRWPQSRSTPTPATSERRQGSNDDEERSLSVEAFRAPRSEEITPKPSTENLSLQTSSLDKLNPSTSNDYNGDESELDESSPQDSEGITMMSPGPLSPSSTAGSTSSLFLPHPGAPKPLMNNKGQIAARPAAIHIATAAAASQSDSSLDSQGQARSPISLSIPATVSLLSTLAMAAERARKVRQTTLYGTTQTDLLSALGPVPIAFSLEGRPPSPRIHDTDFGFPRQSPTSRTPGSPVGVQFPGGDGKTSPAAVQPIPRANFFPSNGRPRPRSRSFSGFSVNDAEVLIPVSAREEGSQPTRGPNMSDYMTSLRGTSPVSAPGRSATLPSAPGQIRSRSPSRGPSRAQRPTHVPSPLSLPAINNPVSTTVALPSAQMAQQNGGNNPDTSKAGLGSLKKKGLRQVSSSGGLRLGSERLRSPPEQPSRTSNDKRDASPRKLSPPRRSISHSTAHAASFDDSDRSELTTPTLIPAGGGSSSSSSPMARSVSLRSKLSISALRSKGSNARPSRDGGDAPFSNLPLANPSFGNDEEERVQVKDMEFELVKPIIKTSGLRMSEDAGSQTGSPGDAESIRSGLDGQGTAWRADSPSTSSPATSYVRSPNMHASADSLANFRNASAIQMASIEAHRLREQKWMTLISTVPSAQAKKSKKIKKLLLEGVPSSVRGRVWGHVTDSKARRMEGLFEQLVKKAPQQLIPIVEQDIERCFPDHPHLQDPRGSLANLLLAYTAMVPDIRYRNGLTRIAGHLLLQAPDEDAFWIFVAVMDSHLRGYYHATNTGQFEIDASLFQSLMESVEPELAQVLFNDVGLRAVDICGSWFSCLFAGVLPPDHLYRVWDVLLYEGPIYLFRVALALMILCKRSIMTMNLQQAGRGPVVELLGRPPMSAIPQDPESFISHTFTVKIRDDDLRKQRSKREVQWKKDRLAQR